MINAQITSLAAAEKDSTIHTGGPEIVIPDMIIIVPLDTLISFAVTLFVFGPEGGSMMGMLGVGLRGPHIGMFLFRGTWATAHSHLGV